ncbi:MAG: hypothetical protein ACYDBB_04930 [Armatimonadota bacterium]
MKSSTERLSDFPEKEVIEAMDVGTIITLDDILPNEHYSFEYLVDTVKSISRTDALLWCGRLNSIISNPFNTDHANNQRIAGSYFLTGEPAKRADVALQQRGGINRNTLFFRGQLLELIRLTSVLSIDQENDGVTFEDPEVNERFLKAALMAGELWASTTYCNLSIEGGRETARRRAAAGFRKAISDNNDAMHPVVAFARGYDLFSEYMPRHLQEFLAHFQTRNNLTIEEYYTAFILIMYFFYSHVLQADETYHGKTGLFAIKHLDGFFQGQEHVLQSFLAMESQDSSELRERFIRYDTWDGEGEYQPSSYRAIRDKPMLYTPDGRAIVLDPTFFSSHAAANPLFSLIGSGIPVNRLFTAFGDAFEDYCHTGLRRFYPSSSMLANIFHESVTLNDRSNNNIDALWDYGKRIVIGEIKAIWIKDEVLLSPNPEDYIEEVRKKLISGDRAKGPAQLARIIQHISSTGIDFNPQFQVTPIDEVEVIIPALIVYDQLMGSTYDPLLLRQAFEELLKPDERMRNGFMRKDGRLILPLLTMTIDEIEFFETLQGQINFADLLFDYASNLHDQYYSLSAYFSSHPDLKSRQQGYLAVRFQELTERFGTIRKMEEVMDRLREKSDSNNPTDTPAE